MPTFTFICETCNEEKKAWRKDEPPRFCSNECRAKGLSGQSLKPVKHKITPELHEQIKKVYQRDTGNGQVAALAKRTNLPRWKITRYAIKQGWIAKQKKAPDWTEAELDILERNAHLSPERIRLRLKKAGYIRTATGIVLKRKRMRLLRNLDGYSARMLAECLGVDDHFIRRAINLGKLKASRRKTNRSEVQGGDPYYIKEKHIRNYILNWLNEIDIRKVDKYWFTDIVAGR